MKALSQGKAKQFFKKPQKKQDLQQIVYELQSKLIAKHVGIADQQISDFKWFFDQISKFKLPSNYQKVLNQKKNSLVYKQKITKQQTTIHPLINLIKTFFYEGHKSNRSTFTFEKKKQKLLPYVEQKMMKNCISLNSKRREVQKVNLQKDQNGNNVLSKMARIKPDIKSLISARSYMLKMLVEKVYTSKEIWGKGKRAKAYASIMSQKRKFAEDQQQDVQKVQLDLDTYQNIFTDAAKFYQQQYGDLTQIPDYIIKSDQYKVSTPQNVHRNMFILNISKNQIQFYWFARLMDCLKIPHNWSKIHTSNYQSYCYEPMKVNFDIHPSYIYIVLQMNKFKNYFNKLPNQQKAQFYKDRQMTFYDFFQRKYTVDIYGLALKEELKKQTKTKNDDKRKNHMQQNANDWMIVQGIRNSNINPSQYTLIDKFCQFWKSKDFLQEQYMPTVSPFGQITWSSTVNYSSIDYCPYKQNLSKKIQSQISKLPKIQVNNFKEQFRKDIKIEGHDITITQNSNAYTQFIHVARQRQIFLQYYLDHIHKPLPTPFYVNGYDLNDYFDQIFFCPFQLDKGVELIKYNQSRNVTQKQKEPKKRAQKINEGNQEDSQGEKEELDKGVQFIKYENQQNYQQQQEEQVPIWLQKIRAKRYQAKIKNLIQSDCDFEEIKQYLARYALQQTMKQEPHRLQDIEQQLRNISSLQQLKRFTQKITNIQQRQQRKRKANQVPVQIKQTDDIFGSQQSNLDPEQIQQSSQQQQSESESQEQEEEVQKMTEINQNSDQSSQQTLVQVPIEQPQIIQEPQPVIQIRQEYSFLKDMQDNQNYETNPYFDKIDNYELQKLYNKKLRNTYKKHKYSRKHLKDRLKSRSNRRLQKKEDENIMKNLVITDLKFTFLPYEAKPAFNKNLNQESLKNLKKIQNCQHESEYQLIYKQQYFKMYDSQMQDYSADQIIQHIKDLPPKQIPKQQTQQSQNPQIFYPKPRQRQVVIQLQPIKRIKPDISMDPYLRHIDTVDSESELTMFKTTFGRKQMLQTQNSSKLIQNQNSPTKFKLRSKSTNNILKSIQKSKRSPDKRQKQQFSQSNKNQSISKFQSIKLLSKKKLFQDTKQSLIFQYNSSFNRVCLGQTASNLLSTQPIKRKSQLIILQARKSLAHKGRGIQTYISKKY